eukprot:CCRYP_014354-RA/>CCRYP_014354-RA protein AED:0.61 eAED:0.43 QI:0/0/0/0.5/1/1/2/0/183
MKHHAKAETWQDHVPRAAVVHTKTTHANIGVASVAIANIKTSPQKIVFETKKQGLPPGPSYYVAISNAYSTFPQYAADPTHTSTLSNSSSPHALAAMPSTFKHKALRCLLACRLKRNMVASEQVLLNHHITWAEDEHTAAAKANLLQPYCHAIDYAHSHIHKPKPTFLQATKNTGYALATNIK